MTIQTPALERLAATLVRAEVERRKPIDVEAVAEYISRHVEVTASGDLVAVDEHGVPRVGPGPDYGAMSVSDLLDEVEAKRPTLFGKPTKTGATTVGTTRDNPFAAGPHYSVTKQMILWRTEPDKAEFLAAEAGVTLR